MITTRKSRTSPIAPRVAASLLLLMLISSHEAIAKLRVAATVPDLAAIASAVGGERARVASLATPHQDPHFVDARPHLILELNRADLLLAIGLDLEVGWLPVLLTNARNGRIQPGNDGFLDCSTVVALRQVPKTRIERSMGDIHPGGNPHYLLDPSNAARVARAIANRMSRLDPPGRKRYEANAQRFVTELAAAQARWQAALKPFRGTRIVTFHRAWVYFAEAMGLTILGQLEPKPGIPPNAAHLLQLMRRMRAEKVPLILCSSYYPDRATQVVARKTGAAVVRVAGGTDLAKGQTYARRMQEVVDALLRALRARKKTKG